MPTELKKHRILIIEDESSLRSALCDKFAREGFSVLDAKDGKTGLALAFAEEPSLLLVDIVMPRMDGMVMLAKLRQKNEWSKQVPVVLLTNLGADDGKIMKVIEADARTWYLVKSNWAIGQVVKKVEEILRVTSSEKKSV